MAITTQGGGSSDKNADKIVYLIVIRKCSQKKNNAVQVVVKLGSKENPVSYDVVSVILQNNDFNRKTDPPMVCIPQLKV